MKLCTPFLEWRLSFITFLCFFTERSYITLPCVSKHSIWLGLSLTFNEPLDDRRKSSCFFTALFHLQYPRHMIWNPETSKCSCCWNFTFFISSQLDFFFCFLFSSHSNSKNHSCNFLKCCEYMTNMVRMCLLWASVNRVL